MKRNLIAMMALVSSLILGGCGGPYAGGAYPYYGSFYDAYYAPYSYLPAFAGHQLVFAVKSLLGGGRLSSKHRSHA